MKTKIVEKTMKPKRIEKIPKSRGVNILLGLHAAVAKQKIRNAENI